MEPAVLSSSDWRSAAGQSQKLCWCSCFPATRRHRKQLGRGRELYPRANYVKPQHVIWNLVADGDGGGGVITDGMGETTAMTLWPLWPPFHVEFGSVRVGADQIDASQ